MSDLDDASLDTPNCAVHLNRMELAGTEEVPEWWCAQCALEPKAVDGPATSPFVGPNAIRTMQVLFSELPQTNVVSDASKAAFGAALSSIDVLAPFVAAAAAVASHAATSSQIEFLHELSVRLDVLSVAVPDLEARILQGDNRLAEALNQAAQASSAAGTTEKSRMLARAAVSSGSWNPIGDLRQRTFLRYVIEWPIEQILLLKRFDEIDLWKSAVPENEAPWAYLAEGLYGASGPDETDAINAHHRVLMTEGMIEADIYNMVDFGSVGISAELSEKGLAFLEFVGAEA